MTIITTCCDEAARRVTDCVAVRSLAATCALVASSRPTPDATSVGRSTCSVELSATSPPSSHSRVRLYTRPLRHHQEIKWGVVKKWKMGVFCKKVDLSSTQGALCTVSVFFILHFTYLGVRTHSTPPPPLPAYGSLTTVVTLESTYIPLPSRLDRRRRPAH